MAKDKIDSTVPAVYFQLVTDLKSEINNQKVLRQSDKAQDQDAIKLLDLAMGHLVLVQGHLKDYYAIQSKLFTGYVEFVERAEDFWIGRIQEEGKPTGTLVMIRKGNLGPGEKLIRRGDNTILVESFGGSFRTPPFMKMV